MRTPPQILIVDDNPANLDIFETRLAAHGYDIITASDGAEGLAVAMERKPDPMRVEKSFVRNLGGLMPPAAAIAVPGQSGKLDGAKPGRKV